jgi:glycogen debranching enzyme GlgX/4-alpha-glucanotransferase
MTRDLNAGSPEPLGVTVDSHGVNVAVFSAHAEKIEICFFDSAGDREIERLQLPERTGDVFHGHVADVTAGTRYGLRAHGPFDPSQGHRFNPAKLLVDPYALHLDRPFRLDSTMFSCREGSRVDDLALDARDSAASMPKAIVVGQSELATPRRPRIPRADTVIYEAHVRGFTKAHPSIPQSIAGTFAGLADPRAIDHLVTLGITTVEILPAAAWIDERHLGPLHLTNYWGYNSIAFMAPDPRLALNGYSEVRASIDALHAAGIEVIVDVVLNHTGEGDEFGPTLSFRGLDNATYYRLRSDDRRRYVDDAGCGNCLALDRLPVVRFAMDTLRSWAILAGIDGFRFDLATALGRRDSGFDRSAPLLAAITQDPILRKLKMIAEPWDIGPGGYQLGAFPAPWGEWNDRFRDDIRRFWRGDGAAGALATRLSGSSDVFGPHRSPLCSVNYITSHDGMTLTDLVSYARKHNDANGEHNRDGTDNNISWNWGTEGPGQDATTDSARQRDQRALLATLLLSRGTPMLAMGSELAHSQSGNNNAYAQDNELSWLNWAQANAPLSGYVRELLAVRKAHAILRHDQWLTGAPFGTTGIADVEWREASGRRLTDEEWQAPDLPTLVVALAATSDRGALDRVTIVLHRGREPTVVILPQPCDGRAWQLLLDSAKGVSTSLSLAVDAVTIEPRCVLVFGEVAAKNEGRGRPRSVDAGLLNALSDAAGIALEWWDIGGGSHLVNNQTKSALLSSMGLAVETNAQARESLRHIAEQRDPLGLPHAWLGAADTQIGLPLRLAPGTVPSVVSLQIEREDGGIDVICVEPSDDQSIASSRANRMQEVRLLRLPPLPPGRHRVQQEDSDGRSCIVTVAPARCYQPPSLANDARAFGIAAQLYALRRPGDQGIGDFTTLDHFGARASALGAATLALNPLHALFPLARERASPYQPSDRRFLDPIYVDLGALADLPPSASLNHSSAATAEWSALSELEYVDYSRVWQLKRSLLEVRFSAFENLLSRQPDHPAAIDFNGFVAAGGTALRRFACFELLCETFGSRCHGRWPPALDRADPPEVEAFARAHASDLRFYLFLQWLADRQLGDAARRLERAGLSLGLYRDLALGAAPDGAEVWANVEQFMQGVSIGAPPDPFSARGQIWHLPPLNPLRLASTGYRSFWEPLRANMRHAGVLRIDHILGLSRLFCIPDGGEARDGTYVSFPLDDLMGQLKLESVRNKCLVVGEDLGTVPEGLRDQLGQAGVLSYRVLWFEKDHSAFKEPASYPSQAAACVSTHDLPTLSGWWIGEDIAERLALGQLSSEDGVQARAERAAEKENLVAALQKAGLASPESLVEATMTPSLAANIHAYVAATPCSLVLAQADDLVGEKRAVNLPGTDRERPNWRRKLAGTIEDLFDGDRAKLSLEHLRMLRPKTPIVDRATGANAERD